MSDRENISSYDRESFSHDSSLSDQELFNVARVASSYSDTHFIGFRIKTVQNGIYSLTMHINTTVLTIKEEISRLSSVAVERQRLIYRGAVLSDSDSLQSRNVQDGHTLHMVARPISDNERPINSSLPPRESQLYPSNNASNSTEINNMQSYAAVPLEHVSQGIFTLQTIHSTILRLDERHGADFDSSVPILLSRAFYNLGQWVDVKDTVEQWLEATVTQIDIPNRKVFIHYNGWPHRWDEWLDMDSSRIAPFRTHTRHYPNSLNHACPNPNTPLSNPPIPTSENFSVVLSQVEEQLNLYIPILRRAAEMSREGVETSQLNDRALWASICRDLCPLSDRLGRVLTDLAIPFSRQAELVPLSLTRPQSLETAFTNLFRNRSQSPPPEQAFRSPILMSQVGELNNNGQNLSSSSVQGNNHMDIHIAIIAPNRRGERQGDDSARLLSNLNNNSSSFLSGPSLAENALSNPANSDFIVPNQGILNSSNSFSDQIFNNHITSITETMDRLFSQRRRNESEVSSFAVPLRSSVDLQTPLLSESIVDGAEGIDHVSNQFDTPSSIGENEIPDAIHISSDDSNSDSCSDHSFGNCAPQEPTSDYLDADSDDDIAPNLLLSDLGNDASNE